MGFTSYFTSYFVRVNIETHARGEILALTLAKAENIKEFIRGQENFMANLGASQVLREYLSNPDTEEKNRAKERLMRTLATDNNLIELLLLDKSGKVVISTGITQEGLDKSQDTFFTQAQNGVYFKDIYYSESIDRVNYAVAAPIKDESGNLDGVIIGRYKPDSFYSIILNRNGLGETGENFIINSNYYFLTPSLFTSENLVLKSQAITSNTVQCFSPQEIDEVKSKGYQNENISHVTSFYDYRGVEVIGTHAYIPETNWCLIGKMDQSEIYSPAKQMVYLIILISIFALIILVLIAYLVASRIAKPIEQLQDGTNIIAKGDLNYKIDSSGQDEIGELARSFNQMVKKIKQSRREIDEKVKEQTSKIRKNEKELEKQQKAIMNILEDVEQERDITSREKDKLNTILHSIGDGVFVIGLDQKIILVNSVALQIVKRTGEKVIGKKYSQVFKFISEDTKKKNDKFILDSLRTGKIQTIPYYTNIIDKKGNEVPVLDSAAPLKAKGGRVIGCVVVFRDITKEREVDKAKTEFVSLASHQLRTPLSAINWFAEMLISDEAGHLTKEQKKYLHEIYNGNQRMVSLVNALLDVSRIELGTLAIEPEPIYFEKISDSVISEQAQEIKKKKLKISKIYGNNLPKIKADPKLIRIVYQNLISNSIKYTPSGGTITISISTKGKYLLSEVADTGYGIPKEEQDKIFTKLFRADNVREKVSDGTGLGLYIVKSIVEQSKGKIWFKSEENKGAKFYFTIPLAGVKLKEGTKGLTGTIE